MTCIYIHRSAEEISNKVSPKIYAKYTEFRSYDLLNSSQISCLGINVGRQEDPGDMYVAWSVVTQDSTSAVEFVTRRLSSV